MRTSLGTLVDDFEQLDREAAVIAPQGLRTVRYSYGQLAALAKRFAAELPRRGIHQGDRVLLCAPNSPEWIAAFFGCILEGVLAVPLEIGASSDFLQRIETEVSPRLVVTDNEHAALFRTPTLIASSLPQSVPERLLHKPPAVGLDDPFQIVFTSGTTGDPKGVVHTHSNVLASLQPIEAEIARYRKYERIFHPLRFLHTLPLSHVFGQFMGLWIPPLLGAETHFESRLVADDLVDLIQRRRISVLCLVPRVLGLLRSYVLTNFPNIEQRLSATHRMNAARRWWLFRDVHKAFGLKCWAFICGGAALPLDIEQFWKELGFVVVQGYGMTETTALVSLNHPFRAAQGTIGQVLPGREVKLAPDGEVLVRGATISHTVWQGGEARKRQGEWLATGDLADFDRAGNLRFRSRKKDVIVTSAGLNIYPEDLEAALRAAGARDAAVTETESPAGPHPVAYLILDPTVEAAEIVARANAQLADFQTIQHWVVWPEPDFPRTSTGKVLKRELHAQTPVPMNDTLDLDSLGRVQLQAEIEQRYGITIPDAAVQQIQTRSDILHFTQTRPPAPATRHVYPRWPWKPFVRFARALFINCIAMPLTRALAKPRVVTRVQALPDQPCLIVANHVTSYDVPLILLALPKRIRSRCAVAMSGEMLLDMRLGRNQGGKWLNLLARPAYWLITALFNVFPLPQKSGFQRSFRHAGEAMDRGYHVLVFPEGRRSDDGAPQPFMLGTGLLWRELHAPALAVHLAGLGELKQAARWQWFRSGAITATLAHALPPPGQGDPAALTARLQAAVLPE